MQSKAWDVGTLQLRRCQLTSMKDHHFPCYSVEWNMSKNTISSHCDLCSKCVHPLNTYGSIYQCIGQKPVQLLFSNVHMATRYSHHIHHSHQPGPPVTRRDADLPQLWQQRGRSATVLNFRFRLSIQLSGTTLTRSIYASTPQKRFHGGGTVSRWIYSA